MSIAEPNNGDVVYRIGSKRHTVDPWYVISTNRDTVEIAQYAADRNGTVYFHLLRMRQDLFQRMYFTFGSDKGKASSFLVRKMRMKMEEEEGS